MRQRNCGATTKNNSEVFLAAIIAVALLAGLPGPARAGLIAADPFVTVTAAPDTSNGQYLANLDIKSGTHNKTAGGPIVGFSAANGWGGSTTSLYRPQVPGLFYTTPTAKLNTQGGIVKVDAGPYSDTLREVWRTLDSYALEGTYYFSSLVSAPQDPDGQVFVNFEDATNSHSSVDARVMGVQWGFEGEEMVLKARPTTAGNVRSTYTIPGGYDPGRTYLFVLKAEVDYSSTLDRISVWVNPADITSETGAGTPTLVVDTGAFANYSGLQVDRLALQTDKLAGVSLPVQYDEPRFGTTWADVVPVTAVSPAPIASEPFTYPLGDLAGNNGGSGWSGAWPSHEAGRFSVVDPGAPLEFVGSGVLVEGGDRALKYTSDGGEEIIARSLDAAESGDVYVSFLLQWDPNGSVGNNNFAAIRLSDATAIGVQGNRASGSGIEDFVVWTVPGQGAFAPDVDLVPGQDYFLVGRLFKDGGSTNYNRFALWVDPDFDDLNTPDALAIGDSGVSSFDEISFRGKNLASGEFVLIDQLRLGATWGDVVTVPEPGSLTLLCIGFVILAACRRRKRG